MYPAPEDSHDYFALRIVNHLALLYFLRDGYLRRRFCAELLGFFPIHSDGSSNVQVNELLSEHYTALTGLPPDMGERMKTLFLKGFGSP